MSAYEMTGHMTPVPFLRSGTQAHIEPHLVDGIIHGDRERDVEVTAVRPLSRTRAMLDWRGCAQFTGGNPHIGGCWLYDTSQSVLVIGHTRGAFL